jgi:hypothetical protein
LISAGQDDDDAEHLAAMLAIECVKLALPEMPLPWPEDLMGFRAENSAELHVFRRSLLRHAGELDTKLTNVPSEKIEAETEYFVHKEIVPLSMNCVQR